MSSTVPVWDMNMEELERFIMSHLSPPDSPSLPKSPPPPHPTFAQPLSELSWGIEDVAMQGMSPRAQGTPPLYPWDESRAEEGTLESLVKQATMHRKPKPIVFDDIKDFMLWFDHEIPPTATAAATVTAAAEATATATAITTTTTPAPATPFSPIPSFEVVVPSYDDMPLNDIDQLPYTHVQETGITGLPGYCFTQPLLSSSVIVATVAGGDSGLLTADMEDREILGGMEQTPLANAISGQDYTKTTPDQYDSISHSRSQAPQGEEEEDDEEKYKKKLANGKFTVLAKRKRETTTHKQSERNRREKINQKIETLQSLVPNSYKTDKASMLDQVIQHLKDLQAQLEMMSKLPSRMMLPLTVQQAIHQHFQMSMMGVGMGRGMGVMNSIPRPFMTVPAATWDNSGNRLPTPLITPAFMPPTTAAATWDNSGNRLPTPPITPASMPPTTAAATWDNSGNRLPTPPITPAFVPPTTAAATWDNSGNRLPTPPITPAFMPPTTAAFMPPVTLWANSGNPYFQATPMGSVMPDPSTAVQASQAQPMTVDAYNMQAAMYGQMQHPPPPNN